MTRITDFFKPFKERENGVQVGAGTPNPDANMLPSTDVNHINGTNQGPENATLTTSITVSNVYENGQVHAHNVENIDNFAHQTTQLRGTNINNPNARCNAGLARGRATKGARGVGTRGRARRSQPMDPSQGNLNSWRTASVPVGPTQANGNDDPDMTSQVAAPAPATSQDKACAASPGPSLGRKRRAPCSASKSQRKNNPIDTLPFITNERDLLKSKSMVKHWSLINKSQMQRFYRLKGSFLAAVQLHKKSSRLVEVDGISQQVEIFWYKESDAEFQAWKMQGGYLRFLEYLYKLYCTWMKRYPMEELRGDRTFPIADAYILPFTYLVRKRQGTLMADQSSPSSNVQPVLVPIGNELGVVDTDMPDEDEDGVESYAAGPSISQTSGYG